MFSAALGRALTDLATRQHGVLSRRQLIDDGLSDRQVRLRVSGGILVPFTGDTFLIAGAPRQPITRYWAATLALPNSVLGTRAAANIHWFDGFTAVPPELIVASGTHSLVNGITVRRRDDLLERHRCTVDGLAVTTIPRTVLDLAAYLPWVELSRLVDDLVDHRRISIHLLFDEFDRIARRGRNGSVALRRVLEPRLVNSTHTKSELERRGREFLRRHGLPDPVEEFRPPWAGPALARVDLAYPDLKVVIELDGRKWHDRSDRFENDRLRDQLAMAHGWIVVRITWRQLHDDANGVATRLRETLRLRSLRVS